MLALRRSAAIGFAILTGAYASLQIVPGGTWTADNGQHIQAHGTGIIVVNGTYFMIGEDKTNGSPFQNVNCYSSTDLVRWQYEGALLSRTAEAGDLGPNRIVERPKVIFNERTQKYVLWMHIDSSDYKDARAGVAVGDSVCGKYTYLGGSRPLGFQSRDSGLFKDDDGTAYLLTEDRENGLRINRLTDDYLGFADTTSTYLWSEHIESPAMLKRQGIYYMFGSKLTGWDPNDNVYSTATSISGPWSGWQTFADKGSNTYASQTTYILPYGSSGNVMYLGDRWVSTNLQSSTYVWLPLDISGTTVSLKNRDAWVPNAAAPGAPWQPAGDVNAYEGEVGKLGGGARVVSCNGCSGGNAAGYIGGDVNGIVTIAGVRSSAPDGTLTTVRIRFANGDGNPRYANVTVNGGAPIRLAFEPTRGGVSDSTLNVQLRPSTDNTIVVSGAGGGLWGPDVDRLIVPVQ
ncbi:hypothetical protein PspLS_06447 [Pyricularia sp. CBS 133598]|nr:hypothetical protein PspLS_06447 [Pyricularia sp. CBS 133598]